MRATWIVLAFVVTTWPAAAEGAALPDGCESVETGYLCEWTFDATHDSGALLEFPVPVVERARLNVTVDFTGAGPGWLYFLWDTTDSVRLLNHQEQQDIDQTEAHVSTVHFFVTDPAHEHVFQFHRSPLPITYGTPDVVTSSQGSFHVRFDVSQLPEGRIPARPAATRDDPHLADSERDAPSPALDVVAAWFDDDAVDDGVFQAYLRVADLSAPYPPRSLNGEGADDIYEWVIEWSIDSTRFTLVWQLEDRGFFACFLDYVSSESNDDAATPRCVLDAENSTFRADILEEAVGFVGPGVPFTDLRAYTLTHDPARQTPDEVLFSDGLFFGSHVEDETQGEERYPFALGGEDVWDELNPRLAAPEVPVEVLALAMPAPWYQEPFSRANLPDTLQVVGAALGSLTFLGGLFFVGRRRRATRRLLARVDAIERAHEEAPRTGIVALASLEGELAAMLHDGALREEQYQLLSARVSAASQRLGVRERILADGASA